MQQPADSDSFSCMICITPLWVCEKLWRAGDVELELQVFNLTFKLSLHLRRLLSAVLCLRTAAAVALTWKTLTHAIKEQRPGFKFQHGQLLDHYSTRQRRSCIVTLRASHWQGINRWVLKKGGEIVWVTKEKNRDPLNSSWSGGWLLVLSIYKRSWRLLQDH